MIPLPSKPKVVKKQGNETFFEIEGLYPGYGITIGNSLRRVLLSSLEGAAITQVKIKGAAHEFSTIPGVLEDVVMILLNLKKLCFKLHTDEPQTAILKVKGEKQVNGKDFKLSSQVELSNPEEHIATITKSSTELNIEAVIEKGIGYQSIESREIKRPEVSVMPIDTIFSPVKNVQFAVENMRVGKRTDFDKLKIEVETDGSLSAESAMKQASDILLGHFSLLVENLDKDKTETVKKEKSAVKTAVKKPVKKTADKTVKTATKKKPAKKTK